MDENQNTTIDGTQLPAGQGALDEKGVFEQLLELDYAGIASKVFDEFFIGTLVAIIVLLLNKYRRKLWHLVKQLFSPPPFADRKAHFTYRQHEQNTDICTIGDEHLSHQSLLGLIEPPQHYGVYTGRQGGRPKIQHKNRSQGKEFRKVLRYLNKCIIPYRLNIAKSLKEKPDWKDSATSDYILINHLLPAFSTTDPILVMIRGKVGCGKSTLITDIANKATHYNSTHTTPGSIAPIVINIRKLLFGKFRFNKDFHETVLHPDFSRQVKRHIHTEIVYLLSEIGIPGITENTSYTEAIESCYSALVSPLIILDELDYLYTDFAKRIVADKRGPHDECMEMYKNVFTDIYTLHRNVPIPRATSGCNAVFIVVARSSTEKLIGELVDTDIMNDVLHIKVDEAEKHRINDMLRAQLDFLRLSAEGDAGRNLKALSDQLANHSIDYSKNVAVSVHGVRHLINAIAKIKIFDDTYNLLRQVAGHPGLLRLYQYIDGNPDYTQAEEGISNIFLVNRDAPKKCRSNNQSVHNIDDWLLQDHLQSYWLKYFLCALIIKRTQKTEGGVTTSRSIDFDDIVDTFHSKTSEEPTQYEESLIKLALFNASKVDHGRLVKFGAGDGKTRQILPARRLLFMDQERLFWDFGYLMVIIEDKWLEFPKDIYPVFAPKDGRTVYDFITTYHTASKSEKLNFVRRKSEQVLAFYLLITLALKYERIRYKAVFRRLREAGVNTEIEKEFLDHLKESIFEFTKTYIGSDSAEKIMGEVDSYMENSTKLGARIEKALKNYHGLPSLRSMEHRMETYYKSRKG